METCVRIASFNVENLSVGEHAEARNTILRRQFERLDADILCLQEVDGDRSTGSGPRRLLALDNLLSGTAYEEFHRAHTTHPGRADPRNRHNLVILSRWPFSSMAQYCNDLMPPPVYAGVGGRQDDDAAIKWDRPILHACVASPDATGLHVINMHLKAPSAASIPGEKIGPYAWKSVSGWAEGYFLAAVKRAGQAVEARFLVDKIFDEDEAALIVVCGDFNAEQRDMAFHIVAGRTEDTGNGQLAGRELIALGHGLPESRRFTVIHGGSHQMLDHILVSRTLLARFRGIEIHNEALSDELIAYTLVDQPLESFHAPVVAEFGLQGELE